jgi:hypothetical protein
MKETELKLEPYDDYETCKKKAHEYLARLLYGISLFERCGHSIKPTVFISNDVLHTIYRGSERALIIYERMPGDTIPVLTICGCNVKTVVGEKNVLSVGFNLLEWRSDNEKN